jgi:hypothetical protein
LSIQDIETGHPNHIVDVRLLRYLKKPENRYRKKNFDNTDISVFFRDCTLLNFMQNLLIIRFQMMPNSHDITALTHQVGDIFNEV